MQRCLETCDVEGVRRLWRHVYPNMPQPQSEYDAIVMLHMARTAAQSLADKFRFYSHRWLLDYGYPSSLPDHLKPSAERMYPKKVLGVGISVNSNSELFGPILNPIRSAMENAVLEVDADGKLHDAPLVKQRMFAARRKVVKQLLGIIGK